jgi:hypothetical protein
MPLGAVSLPSTRAPLRGRMNARSLDAQYSGVDAGRRVRVGPIRFPEREPSRSGPRGDGHPRDPPSGCRAGLRVRSHDQ